MCDVTAPREKPGALEGAVAWRLDCTVAIRPILTPREANGVRGGVEGYPSRFHSLHSHHPLEPMGATQRNMTARCDPLQGVSLTPSTIVTVASEPASPFSSNGKGLSSRHISNHRATHHVPRLGSSPKPRIAPQQLASAN